MISKSRKIESAARDVAYAAVGCALMIGVQYVFSFVAGIEFVTVIFACFCAVFGIRRGVLCAVAFSLLRCIIFGFSPNVVALYAVYYPLFAVVMGALGKVRAETVEKKPLAFVIAVNAVLLLVVTACALALGLNLIKISRIWKATVTALLWVILALSLAALVVFDTVFFVRGKRKKARAAVLLSVTFASAASVMTALFTLLDDAITPLMLGYSRSAALAYFYSSFTAMLPGCVCAFVSVAVLIVPLTAAMRKAVKL